MLLPTEFTSSVCLVLAALLPAGLSAQADADAGSAVEVQGHRTLVDDIDVIHLRGTPTEQAFAEGYLCAEEIPALFRDFALNAPILPREVRTQAGGLWNLVVLPMVRSRVVVSDLDRQRAEALLDGIAARDPDLLEIPELRRELTADDMIAAATLPDFLGLRCSSFVAWGDRIGSEGPLVGRNLDYFATEMLLEKSMVFVRAGSEGRRGYVSVGWPGILGCLTAVSEDGLVVAIHDVPAKAVPETKITPRPIALLGLLETVELGRNPVAAATAALRGHTYGMGGNFLFGWRGHGDEHGPGGAVFEVYPAATPAEGVTARVPQEGQSWITCSNHHRERVTAEERQCWRYDALFDGVGGVEDAMDLEAARALIRESEVRGTLHQVVVDLATGELHLRLRRKPRQDEWSEAGPWNVAELLAEAKRGSKAVDDGGR